MGGKRKKLFRYFWDVLILACFTNRAMNFGQDKFFGRLATICAGIAVIATWIIYYEESKPNYINMVKKISIQFSNAFLTLWVLWNISNGVRNVHIELTPVILACHIGVGIIILMDVMYYLRLKRVKQ